MERNRIKSFIHYHKPFKTKVCGGEEPGRSFITQSVKEMRRMAGGAKGQSAHCVWGQVKGEHSKLRQVTVFRTVGPGVTL